MTIGSRVGRVEDGRLLTGRGYYVGDVALPRMLHAAFIRSDRAHARVVEVDVERARQLPGVVAVLTGADVAPVTLVSASRHPKLMPTPQPILARDRVRFIGEAIGVVIAEYRYVAEDALEAVTVEYEDLRLGVGVEVDPSPGPV